MRWPWQPKTADIEQKALDINTVMENLAMIYRTSSGAQVHPDTCMQSPTMHAIVTAVSRRISVAPMHVYQLSEQGGRMNKELIPNHAVSRLLANPNQFQSENSYWLDMVSTLLRWGNFYGEKVLGSETRRTRILLPHSPSNVQIDERNLRQGSLVYRITELDGTQRLVDSAQMHHVRLGARNYVVGDSPVQDVREAIAMEIAAEQMGAEVFGNSALPFLAFEYMEGVSKGLGTEEQVKQFLQAVAEGFGNGNRHRAMVVPNGLRLNPVDINNERAQFLETRKHQRTVIAGAFGVPPHLVGDLERGTFNNVEQQDKDFVINVILPIVRVIESAMERDLLTPRERSEGVVIRFNLDEVQRADFKGRQEGLFRQRQAGVISANDWREREGMNPRNDEGGEEYWQPVNMADDGPNNDQSMEASPDGPQLRAVEP